MTYSLEMIVNLGPYEHAKLTITEDSSWQLSERLDDLDDDLAVKIGRTAAALKGAVLHGRDNPEPMAEDVVAVEADQDAAEELVKRELGATVLAVEDAPGPVTQKPWERAVEAPSKPWEGEPPVGTTVEVGGISFTKKSMLDDIFG